jgi:mRNA interferase HigB
MRNNDFANFAEVKAKAGSVDQVSGGVVFNIHGNAYRLIAKIEYRFKKVFIRCVLTHKEYDEGGWK